MNTRTKTGVGISHHRNPQIAGKEAVDQALQNGDIDKPDFVFMFASVGYDQPTLLAAVREATGRVPLCGCSGEGVIALSEADESSFSVAVMVIRSDELQFHNGLTTGLAEDSAAVGQAVATAIQPSLNEQTIGLFVFPDAFTTNFDAFKNSFESTIKHDRFLPMLGGAASENLKFIQTYQYHNDQVVSDSVSWVLLSGAMKVAWAVNHGCIPIGASRTITRSEGNIIYEIDNKSALEVLQEYMTADKIDDWGSAIAVFSLGFKAPSETLAQDEYFIRVMLGGVDEEAKSVILTTPVTEGSRFWMTRRDYRKIRDGIDQIGQSLKTQLGANPAKLVFHFECTGRGQMFLRDSQKQYLLNSLQEQLGENIPWLGLYCHFEIGPMQQQNQLHNYTSVVAALYTDDVQHTNGTSIEAPTIELDGSLKTPVAKMGSPQDDGISSSVSQPDTTSMTEHELRIENQRLAEEVKRLVETEHDLYKTQEQLDSQFRLYRQLYETGKKFSTAPEIAEVLQVATQFVLYGLNFERCLIFLYDSTQEVFQVQALDGYYESESRQAAETLGLSNSESGLSSLINGEPHLVCTVREAQEDLMALGQRLQMDEGYILMRLSDEANQLIGFLAAGNTTEMSGFQTRIDGDSDTLMGLANLAGQLSISIRNTRLFAEQVATNQILRATNQQLESFAFSAAHTLKTDWQGVGYLVDEIFEIIEEAEDEDEEPEIDEILESLKLLRPRVTKGIQTTDDLLTYARLGGKVNQTAQDLRTLVEGVVERVDNDLVQIAANFPQVTFPLDEKTFPVALIQIVENALTYGEGKPVSIFFRNNQLHIQDQGRGIPAESLDSIFGLFKRVATDVKGTGVGLALSKQITLAHGFDIWAESEGEGSTFIINFGGSKS